MYKIFYFNKNNFSAEKKFKKTLFLFHVYNRYLQNKQKSSDFFTVV